MTALLAATALWCAGAYAPATGTNFGLCPPIQVAQHVPQVYDEGVRLRVRTPAEAPFAPSEAPVEARRSAHAVWGYLSLFVIAILAWFFWGHVLDLIEVRRRKP